MWLCDYCGKELEEPIVACDTCYAKPKIKKNILLKHQEHQIAIMLKHIKKPRTGHS